MKTHLESHVRSGKPICGTAKAKGITKSFGLVSCNRCLKLVWVVQYARERDKAHEL